MTQRRAQLGGAAMADCFSWDDSKHKDVASPPQEVPEEYEYEHDEPRVAVDDDEVIPEVLGACSPPTVVRPVKPANNGCPWATDASLSTQETTSRAAYAAPGASNRRTPRGAPPVPSGTPWGAGGPVASVNRSTGKRSLPQDSGAVPWATGEHQVARGQMGGKRAIMPRGENTGLQMLQQ
eukprot:TRINITY_DN929_c0_g6_i1.p2 TRINITY_DN929_c0_g6~~TRINITY_DN929_c0_g6_i1.p2  ORF type:complete len:180 (+),score=59.01 TRINITY_DN929_c0_g6_i1:60-599(+)